MNSDTSAIAQTTGNSGGTAIVKPENRLTKGWTIKNVSAQNGGTASDAWIGFTSGVTTSNGFYLAPGDSLSGQSPSAIYGTPAVAFAYMEVSNAS